MQQAGDQDAGVARAASAYTGAYAGDVPPRDAFDALARERNAILVDVRTQAEWSFVGIADLSGLGKDALLIEWQTYPAMSTNPRFAEMAAQALSQRGADSSAPIYFLCRSGARSRSAAMAMTAAGFAKCFNITGGFEGDHDASGHRGNVSGWKAADLPWRQG